jgi:2,3-bisphosphoglycerate-dependent phosphoglycerate mutase
MPPTRPRPRPPDRAHPPAPPRGEIVLIRHGQGECNAAGLIGGRVGCEGLSDLGRAQSAALAERVAQLDRTRPFEVLLCTPRLRVLQCAQIIGARLERPVTVVDTLRGQEFGVADGRSWLQVTRAFGGPPAHDPDRPIAEGAEPWNVYADRVRAALARVLAEHAGRRILLVGHGKTAGMAGALLSGVCDPSAVTDFIVEHGGLSHWRQRADGWDLVVHNDLTHLLQQPSAPAPDQVR